MSLPILHKFITDWNNYDEEGFEDVFTDDVVFTILKEPTPERKSGNEVKDWLQSLISALRNFHLNKAKAELIYYIDTPAVLLTYYLHSELTGLMEATVHYVFKTEFRRGKICSIVVIRSFDFRDVTFPVGEIQAN